LARDLEAIQDNFDLDTIYEILKYSAGLAIKKDENEEILKQAKEESEDSSWDTLDLAKLETEVFILGIWKSFEELETSICMEELMQIISTRRELDYEEKKFSAALQGVDLEGEGSSSSKGQKEWEDLQARVYSRGATSDSSDILALQGQNAVNAGFGIGMGLSYEDLKDPSVML
jgi:hypothetical protein